MLRFILSNNFHIQSETKTDECFEIYFTFDWENYFHKIYFQDVNSYNLCKPNLIDQDKNNIAPHAVF